MKAVKLGVLGVSGHFIKRTVLPLKKSSKVELFAIASRDENKAASTAKKFDIPKSYGSYESLLNDPEVEMVYIPLPNHLHAKWIKASADAGKHILCEKPIAMSAGEAEDAIAYASSKGVLVMEAFMYRFQPQWIRAREIAQVGEIGSLVSIETFFSYHNPDPSNIRNIAEYGGGALMDIGCYAVSVPRFIFGAEPVRAISLIAYDDVFKTDKHVSAILDFNGRRASFTVSTQAFPYQKVFIHGSSGDMVVQTPFNTFTDVPAVLTVTNSIGKRDIHFEPYDQYGLQFNAFAEAIRNGGPAPTPPDDAIKNMRVIDAIFRSAKTGQWEKI